MVEAALVFGLIIFLGIGFILIKLPRKMMLWLLGRAMWLDIVVTVFTLIIHWGTMTGLMSAAVAGLMCSLATSIARWYFGYIRGGKYYPGYTRMEMKKCR